MDWDIATYLFGEEAEKVREVYERQGVEAEKPKPAREPPTETLPAQKSGKWWPKNLPVLSFETWSKLRATGGIIDKAILSTGANIISQGASGPQGGTSMKMSMFISLATEVASAIGSPLKDAIDNWPHIRPDISSPEYKKLVEEGVYEEPTEEELAAARGPKGPTEAEYTKKSKAMDKALGKILANSNNAAMLQAKLLNAQGEERDPGAPQPIGVKIFKSDAVFRQNYTNLNMRQPQSINPTFGRIGF